MRTILNSFRTLLLYTLMIQCCAGFTFYKLIRAEHVHKYIHSKECIKNALLLDCFDECNGIQNNCEQSQKNDKDSDAKNASEIQAVIFYTLQILPSETKVIAQFIIRDDKLVFRESQAIFQPPKTL